MSTVTFGIIKPDAVRTGKQGTIIQRILDNGFNIRGMKLIHQTRKQAEGFYAVHAGKGFYEELTEFMSSGPCVVLALEKENAVHGSDSDENAAIEIGYFFSKLELV
jgi:nucleoside-diphosphate kinase